MKKHFHARRKIALALIFSLLIYTATGGVIFMAEPLWHSNRNSTLDP